MKMNIQRCFFAVLSTLLVAGVAIAQNPYPMLMSLKPTAAQVGQTSEHLIKSRYNMFGANQVFVTGQGVVGEIIHPEVKKAPPKKEPAAKDAKKDAKKAPAKKKPPVKKPNLQQIKIRFTVAPDALPGVRDFRIATPQGVSTLGQLVIVRDAVVVETANNNTAEQAQQVTVPSTICGTIEKAEDVDFFKFKVAADKSFNFHVRSQRLQDKIHDMQKHSDPILTLKNALGSTLASSDNYFYGDPFLSYTFKDAGEYMLEIRDVRYQGNQYWEYSIEASDKPFVSNVHPIAVAAGKDAKLQLVGHQLPNNAVASLKVPMGTSAGRQWLQLPMGKETTNPVPVVVSDLPQVIEAAAENNEPAKGQAITVPAGISGRIESESDIDCYTFEAKKGEKFSFEVVARRHQSSLDSHLRILNDQGKQLKLNDDLRFGERGSADSWLENWTAPADGKYSVEIRDALLRGGPAFVYFLKVTRSQPYFELFIDTDKTQLTPGTSGTIFVRAIRKNGFAGEIQLGIADLPAGVKATCGRILAADKKGRDGCIVLEAAAGAKPTIGNITISGTAVHPMGEDKTMPLSAVAMPYQEIYQPGGGRGHWPSPVHTVSIAAPNDVLSIELSSYDISLKPGESKKIDVTVRRSADYQKNITLDVIFKHLSGVHGNSLPQGVTLDGKTSKTLLTGKETKGTITLTAAATAVAAEKQIASVMANVSLNFVMKATYSSKPLTVTVVKPEEKKPEAAAKK